MKTVIWETHYLYSLFGGSELDCTDLILQQKACAESFCGQLNYAISFSPFIYPQVHFKYQLNRNTVDIQPGIV